VSADDPSPDDPGGDDTPPAVEDGPGAGADLAVGDPDLAFGTARRLPVRRRTLAFLAVATVVLSGWYYEEFHVTDGLIPPWGWSPGARGYLLYVALAFFLAYGLVPLLANPDRARAYWRRLRRRPTAVLAAAYLAAFAVAGTFGPGIVEEFDLGNDPRTGRPPPRAQPPVFASFNSTEVPLYSCLGSSTDGVCQGTAYFPLGTTVAANDMIDVLVEGTRIALEIAVLTGALVVPLATVVGVVAAYYGGWIDEALMRVVDAVRVVPAVLVVIFLQETLSRGLLLTVVAFGLLEWGSVARLVRSEALSRVDEAYVDAARSAGLSDLAVVRRHLVPNVSATLVTAITELMGKLVAVEAAIAFLGWGAPTSRSWGATIRLAVFIQDRGMMTVWPGAWWNYLFPGLLLLVTVGAFSVVGDAAREVLDPRGE